MDKEPKITASDVLFGNVFQISEDMIQATYKLVEEISKFESVFHNMTKKLDSINGNLTNYIIKQKPPDFTEGLAACQDVSDFTQSAALIVTNLLGIVSSPEKIIRLLWYKHV